MGDKSIRLDGRKIGWIGAPSKDTVVCAIMGFTGPKTFEEIRKSGKAVKMGATRSGNAVHLPMMLNKWAGTTFEIIPGYGGTSRIRLAMQSREVDGGCWSWESMRTTARAMLNAKGGDELIPFIIDENWDVPRSRRSRHLRRRSRILTTSARTKPGTRPTNCPPAFASAGGAGRSAGNPAARVDRNHEGSRIHRRRGKVQARSQLCAGGGSRQASDLIYSIPQKVQDNLQFLMRKPSTS